MSNNLKLFILLVLIANPLKTFSATQLSNSYTVTEGRISSALGVQIGKNFSQFASNQASLQGGLLISALGDLNQDSSLYAELSVLKSQFAKNEFTSYELTGTSFSFAFRTRVYKNFYTSIGFGSLYAFELANVDAADLPHKSLDLIYVSFVYETKQFDKNVFYDLRFGNYFTDLVNGQKTAVLAVGFHFGE